MGIIGGIVDQVYLAVFIISTYLILLALGDVSLTSSISSLELSGLQCPSNITLWCNRTGSDDVIDWYVGDNLVARFEADESTPYMRALHSSRLDGNVILVSFNQSVFPYVYINYTLTANVNNWLSIKGQNVTCGTNTDRSEPFQVKEFITIDESFSYNELSGSARYRANFKGSTGTLQEVEIFWNNTMSVCRVDITYSVSIDYNNKHQTKTVTSQQCSNGLCSAVFYLTSNTITDITVRIYAGNHFISSTTIANTTGNAVTIDDCSEEVLIQCSSFTNVNCTVNYEKSLLKRTVMIQSGLTHHLSSRDILEIEIIISNESLTLKQCINITTGSCSQPSSRTGLIVGVVIAVVVVVVAIGLVVAVVVAVFSQSKSKRKEVENHQDFIEIDGKKIYFDEMSVDENGIVVDKQGKGIFEEFWHSSLRGHLRRGTIEKRLAILEERNDKLKKALEEHRLRKMNESIGNHDITNFNRPTPSATSYLAEGYASLDRGDANDHMKDNEYNHLHEFENKKNSPLVDTEYSQSKPESTYRQCITDLWK